MHKKKALPFPTQTFLVGVKDARGRTEVVDRIETPAGPRVFYRGVVSFRRVPRGLERAVVAADAAKEGRKSR